MSRRRKKRPNLSMAARIIALSLLMAGTAAAAMLYLPWFQSDSLNQEMISYEKSVADLLADITRSSILRNDTTFISSAVHTLASDSGIILFVVIDSRGRPIYHFDLAQVLDQPPVASTESEPRHGLSSERRDMQFTKVDLLAEGRSLGRILIGKNIPPVDNTPRATMLILVLLFSSILSVGVVAAVVTNRLLKKPLEAIAEATRAIPQGDSPAEMPISRLPEFRPVFDAFTSTADLMKQQFAELRESEQLYRSVVDILLEGILIVADERIVYANNRASCIAEYESEEIIGERAMQHVFPEDRPRTARAILRLDRGRSDTAEWKCRIIDKAGNMHWVQAKATATTWHDQPATMILLSDISEKRRDEEALRFTRFSIDRIVDCAYWVDQAGRLVHMNEAARRFVGKKQPEGAEKRIYEIHCNLDRTAWPELWNKIKRERQITYDSEFADASGGLRSTEVSASFQDFQGAHFCCFLVRDTSERKVWERQLSQLAEYPKSNPNMVFSIDSSGNLLYRNPAVVKTLREMHLDPSEIWKILPACLTDNIDHCIQSKRVSSTLESRYENRAWLWTIAPTANNKVVHVYAAEVSDRLEADAHRAKLSAVVQQSHNTVVITSTTGMIEYANPMFVKVTGMTAEEVKNLEVSIVKSGIEGPSEYSAIWDSVRKQGVWTGTLKNRKINGEFYWAREIVSEILDNNNELIGYLFVGQDVTKEIDLQQKVIESDKLSAVGMLAAGVAHEFKNYLGGIIGNASFALDDLDGENGLELARETLEQVISLGEKANDVAMSLLTYSRAKPEEVSPEDLKTIVDKSISLVEKEMSTLGIELVFYHEDVPEVSVSASKIQQLLLNLLINAQHAIKNNGVITIALVRDGGKVKIKIGDSGCGIPEAILNRIFDPFFSTKGVWGNDEVIGTGMGLAICRNIAREHGGELEASSIVGMGSTFVLSLPLDEEHRSLKDQVALNEEIRVVFFSLDNESVSQYFKQGVPLNVTVLPVDDFSKVPIELDKACDLVICDARFSAKVELYKTGDRCKKCGIPYIMINCGSMEYQLCELYDDAEVCFKEDASLARILEVLRKKSESRA